MSIRLSQGLLKSRQPQLPRPGPDGQPIESSHLAEALAVRISEKVRAEISQDLGAYNAYVEKHGSPAEMLREHLADRDDAA
jgi:hypothetical protein